MVDISKITHHKIYGECPSCGFRQEIKQAARQEYDTDEHGNYIIVNIAIYECPKCHQKWLERWISQLK